MARLPILTGREIIRALEHAGFERRNQVGSHVQLVGIDLEGCKYLVTVPDHIEGEVKRR